jgi:signal transduction histidine kinase
VRAAGELWASVDPMRVEQVVTNLVDNAIKYSPTGGPIELTLQRLDGHLVELEVRDHGPGIPAEKRSRAFEPFYQAHAVSQHSAGLGLGLHISRQIVELHGGRIALESPADGGTVVVVCLPLAPGNQRDGDPQSTLTGTAAAVRQA